MQERINGANARSRRVPALHARGIALTPWIVWPVILASMALCLSGEIRTGFRRRD